MTIHFNILSDVNTSIARKPTSAAYARKLMKRRLKALNDSQICALDLDLPEKPVRNRKFVVIMASSRSGSSFLGSLFENSEQVMYFYEPFKGVVERTREPLQSDTVKETVDDLLHSMASCSFSSSLSQKLIDDISASVHFPRLASRAFISSPLCSKWCTRHWLCPPLHYQDVSHVCQSKLAIIAKTIRITNISVLWHYAQSVGNPIPIHVLHLVRDPRLTIMSRLNVASLGSLYNSPSRFKNYSENNNISAWTMQEAESLCSQMRFNIEVLRRPSTSAWKYTRLAYEDLIGNPYQTVRKLYQRYGLKLTPDVTQRIAVNTQISARSQDHRELFSVKRNLVASQQVWERLRQDPVNKQYIRITEDACRDVMDYFGYNII